MSAVLPIAPPDLAGRAPVVVVGGGAAGLMAAAFAAEAAAARGVPVVLVERTRQGGKKIVVSGGGRCNVLPSEVAPGRFVTASSPNLLRRMLTAWPLDAQRRYFERVLGLPLALEAETGKLFPASNRATDVRDALVARARALGVTALFDARVTDLAPADGPVRPDGARWLLRLADGRALGASAVVLATGGLSVPNTGSDGFGLDAARRLGHTVHPLYPALTPLTAHDAQGAAPHAALAGLSLTATLHAPLARGRFETTGGFLFTHRGYSGPAMLDASHLAVRSRLAGGPRQSILARWTALDADAWDALLRESSGAAHVGPLVRRHLPTRLADALLAEAAVPPERPLAELRRDERRRLVDALTRYPLPWTGDEGYKKAEVTGGGVDLGEVDPRTMESRLHPGLFLCGELLDAFGPIGGHNFLWAWGTGRAAGLGAAGTFG